MTIASTITKSAPLSGEFGRDYATWLFGAEALAGLPVYTRGKHKGQPKGFVIWLRTTSAGYHTNAGTGVREGTTVRAWLGAHEYTAQNDAVRSEWLGRIQQVCGSLFVLGPANRERWMAQEAALAAKRQREIEEIRAELNR